MRLSFRFVDSKVNIDEDTNKIFKYKRKKYSLGLSNHDSESEDEIDFSFKTNVCHLLQYLTFEI
jgi:hypothetical protein